MTAMFYDKGKTPMKTVHFGATGFIDYIIAPIMGKEDTDILKHIKREFGRLYVWWCAIRIYVMGI